MTKHLPRRKQKCCNNGNVTKDFMRKNARLKLTSADASRTHQTDDEHGQVRTCRKMNTIESDGQPLPPSSSLALISPVDIHPLSRLLLHTPKTLQATQAAQNQPLKQYFQSELYRYFSSKAREVIERVDAERRREEERNKPVFRPTKHVKPPVWTPEVSSRTRKPLMSPDNSPPLIRRPLEQAAKPADLNTEEVQMFVAKPFNTVCNGIHGYVGKFPILMNKPPADNDGQSPECSVKQQSQQHKGSPEQKLATEKPKSQTYRTKGEYRKTEEVLNIIDYTEPLDRSQTGKGSPDQEEQCLSLEAVEFFNLLPDRALAQILRHLDTRSLGALKCTCQDFKCLIDMYELGVSDTSWSTDPEHSQDPSEQ